MPNGKAGKALNQASYEKFGAVKASYLTRETAQITPEAREGKPRAETGRNTQTKRTSDDKGGKPVKLLMVSDLKIHLANAAQPHVFEVKLWALGAFCCLQKH